MLFALNPSVPGGIISGFTIGTVLLTLLFIGAIVGVIILIIKKCGK